MSLSAAPWVEAAALTVEGLGWAELAAPFDRLPARAESMVRAEVWNLSRNTAGVSVGFVTTAERLTVRWTLRGAGLAMPHMPATGVSGVDLYARATAGWTYVGTGQPTERTNETAFDLPAEPSEYRLYLPLYNGVTELRLAVPKGASVGPAPADARRPIVFYGTSIVQGGCASRPGLSAAALAARSLDWPAVNLGFSGNARSEPEVAALLAELDAEVFVIDPLWNMSAEEVAERLPAMVRKLRAAHAATPILLVEDSHVHDAVPTAKGRVLRSLLDDLRGQGIGELHLLTAEGMLGVDGEGTVDGVHPNDLGFARQAAAYVRALGPLLAR